MTFKETPVFGLKETSVALEGVRTIAVDRLKAYLTEDQNRILKEDQSDVMQSLHDFFAAGETAGYISLPSGYGKTIITLDLVKALDLKTLILSPTKTILKQTNQKGQEFTPETAITNYYSGEKDSSGTVINSTYHSAQKLIKEEINPEEIGLVICDEVHTAFGEQRHTIYRNFPNALLIGLTATPYFTALEGYKKRGLVEQNERWTGLFTELIHEMTLEEAIELGILSPLNVHMVKTYSRVEDIQIVSGNKYNPRQLERYLNTETRNYLTMAMLAGPDKLPPTVRISKEQKQDLVDVHEKIRDRRTVVFGLSIDHIEELALRLRELGLKAEAIHNKLKDSDRDRLFKRHASGDLQILLGVDLLRLGWDSPATEVGIYLAPTRSGIVAVQELGRILRLSPETDKEKAIAIQLIDEYKNWYQEPILIPDIFDPYYVLRGTQTGEERIKPSGKHRESLPLLSFEGLEISSIIERVTSEEILRRRLKQASINELHKVIDELIQNASEQPFQSIVDFYQAVGMQLPYRIPIETQQILLQGLASIDTNTVRKTFTVLSYLYANSIVSGILALGIKDEILNEEMFISALSTIRDTLTTSIPERLTLTPTGKTNYLSIFLNNLAKQSSMQYLADQEGIPRTWIVKKVPEKVATFLKKNSRLGRFELSAKVDELADSLGVSRKHLWPYVINRRSFQQYLYDMYVNATDNPEGLSEFNLERQILRNLLREALEELPWKERTILELRFGLYRKGGQTMTLEEVGKELGYTKEYIRTLESKALSKLRGTPHYYMLREFLED